MTTKPLQLYGFHRSQATYRIRVALNLKGIPYTETLDKNEQYNSTFLAINPLGSVPALLIPGSTEKESPHVVTHSLAILEYIEETHPSKRPLLPQNAMSRARVRSLASLADSHPLIVPRRRTYLTSNAGFSASQWKAWQMKWFVTALVGFEHRLNDDVQTGRFCHGDGVTWANICLMGLIEGARAFEIKIPKLVTVERIVGVCEGLDAFEKAKAVHQSDYPKE